MLLVLDFELLLLDPFLVMVEDDWNQYLIELDILYDLSKMITSIRPLFILSLRGAQLVFVTEYHNL